MRNPIANAVVPITKRDIVSCKRCGCPNLAWVTYKSGKHGLVEVAYTRPLWRGDGPPPEGLWALKFNFHKCEQYTALKAEIERRASQCHPKADNPREILSDAICYLIDQFSRENGGPTVWATIAPDSAIVTTLTLLSKAQSKIQQDQIGGNTNEHLGKRTDGRGKDSGRGAARSVA